MRVMQPRQNLDLLLHLCRAVCLDPLCIKTEGPAQLLCSTGLATLPNGAGSHVDAHESVRRAWSVRLDFSSSALSSTCAQTASDPQSPRAVPKAALEQHLDGDSLACVGVLRILHLGKGALQASSRSQVCEASAVESCLPELGLSPLPECAPGCTAPHACPPSSCLAGPVQPSNAAPDLAQALFLKPVLDRLMRQQLAALGERMGPGSQLALRKGFAPILPCCAVLHAELFQAATQGAIFPSGLSLNVWNSRGIRSHTGKRF